MADLSRLFPESIERIYAEGEKILMVLHHGYYSANRFYHNWNHILSCLKQSKRCGKRCAKAPELKAAIWFHDAVYAPNRSDNEEQSALLARQSLTELRLPEDFVDSVSALIMVTRHFSSSDEIPERGSPGAVIRDLDLAILGYSRRRFAEYEYAIRREYAHLEEEEYRRRRSEVLKHFLSRDRLFINPEFQKRYADRARRNIASLLGKLSKGYPRENTSEP